ncbi:O-antigen ligase family protein [Deinococcus sp. PEB2-63]
MWLALLAPLYVISPLALVGLANLNALPGAAKILLVVFVLSQQLPALLTETPLQASLSSLVRTLLTAGLVGMGASWQSSNRLMPISVGLVIVMGTAVLMTLLGGIPLLSSRLSHPYMTPITLGLAGALCIWLALFGQASRAWRLFIGCAGVSVLLLSASRGPLLAAVIGVAAGLLVHSSRRRVLMGVGAAVLLAAGISTLSVGEGNGLLTRLVQSDTNGRDLVWANALSAYQSAPLTGVGPYFLGRHLQSPGTSCELWTGPTGTMTCPSWLKDIGSPWLIAHNGALHQLAETGPLGLAGLFILIGAVVLVAWRSRDALGTAVLSGLLVANMTDNTLIAPSAFYAETFWLIAGVQLSRTRELKFSQGLTGAALLALLAFPVWVAALSARPGPPGTLLFIRAPESVTTPQGYTTYTSWRLVPGQYRLVLRSCLRSCAPVQVTSIDTRGRETISLEITGSIRNVPLQNLQLQLYPATAGTDALPLATHEWSVSLRR